MADTNQDGVGKYFSSLFGWLVILVKVVVKVE